MIQRRRRHSQDTPVRATSKTSKRIASRLRNELLAQIASGVRAFEVADRAAASSVDEFQERVRVLESLVRSGLITIGARDTSTAGATDVVLAVRRIRLTEAGKRHAAVVRSADQSDR